MLLDELFAWHDDVGGLHVDYLADGETAQMSQAWNPALHPRQPAGRPDGGEFARAPGAPGADAPSSMTQAEDPAQRRARRIRSPEFKRWFGDWENDPGAASKVVDAQGQPQETASITAPRAVYHGTKSRFESFDPNKNDKFALFGKGFYFTEDRAIAEEYRSTKGWAFHHPAGLSEADNRQRIRELLHSRIQQLDDNPQYGFEKNWVKHVKSLPVDQMDKFFLLSGLKQLQEKGVSMEGILDSDPPPVIEAYLNIRKPWDADEGKLTAADLGLPPEVWNDSADDYDRGLGRTIDEWRAASDDEYQTPLISPKRLIAALPEFATGPWHEDGRFLWAEFIRSRLQAMGYDGITHIGGGRYRPVPGGTPSDKKHRVWIAWHPTQVKSIDNQGSFSPEDPRMQYSLTQLLTDAVARYSSHTLSKRIAAAAEKTDTAPSDAAQKAGNYAKGKFWLWGHEITIETPAGAVRRGKGWEHTLPYHYGYIRRTRSKADGDQIDVILGPQPKSEIVFIVDQVKPGGRFDEHKVMLGWTHAKAARQAYLDCYAPGWDGFGSLTAMTRDDFLEWLEKGDTSKRAAHYSLSLMFQAAVARYDDREGQWITIGGHPAGGKKHAGGTPVKVDGSGTITAGPDSIEGRKVDQLSEKPGDGPKLSGQQVMFKELPQGQQMLFAPGESDAFEGDLPKYHPLPGWTDAWKEGREQPAETAAAPATPPEDRHQPKTGPGVVSVKDLDVDPQRFQYKLNTRGAHGVTDQFSDVKFNPEIAGTIHVWRDPQDGRDYVINGHHRFDLAKRSGYDGQLQVYWLNAKDAQEARARGALINIAGGNGTAVDAAKFMRDTGMSAEQMNAEGVSLKGAVARDAAVLSKLSGEIFRRVAIGTYRLGRALAIARHLPNPEDQDRLDRFISAAEEKGKDISDSTVEEMARDAAMAGRQSRTTKSLFGEETEDRGLFLERAELKGALRRELTGRLNKFRAVATDRAAKTLEGANTINAEQNRAEVDRLESFLHDFDRETSYRGPVSDRLNQAAQELASAPRKRADILARLHADIGSLVATVPQADAGAIPGNGQGGEGGDSTRIEVAPQYESAAGQRAMFALSLEDIRAQTFAVFDTAFAHYARKAKAAPGQKSLFDSDWDESAHPRGDHGMWVHKEGGLAPASAPAPEAPPAAPQAKTTAAAGGIPTSRENLPQLYESVAAEIAQDPKLSPSRVGELAIARIMHHHGEILNRLENKIHDMDSPLTPEEEAFYDDVYVNKFSPVRELTRLSGNQRLYMPDLDDPIAKRPLPTLGGTPQQAEPAAPQDADKPAGGLVDDIIGHVAKDQTGNRFKLDPPGFRGKWSSMTDEEKQRTIASLKERGAVSSWLARRRNPPTASELLDDVTRTIEERRTRHEDVATNRHEPWAESDDYKSLTGGKPAKAEKPPAAAPKSEAPPPAKPEPPTRKPGDRPSETEVENALTDDTVRAALREDGSLPIFEAGNESHHLERLQKAHPTLKPVDVGAAFEQAMRDVVKEAGAQWSYVEDARNAPPGSHDAQNLEFVRQRALKKWAPAVNQTNGPAILHGFKTLGDWGVTDALTHLHGIYGSHDRNQRDHSAVVLLGEGHGQTVPPERRATTLQSGPAAAAPVQAAPPKSGESPPPPVPGAQRSLFGGQDMRTGQRALFDVAKPSKSPKPAKQQTIHEAMGTTPIESAEQVDSLEGQRALFSLGSRMDANHIRQQTLDDFRARYAAHWEESKHPRASDGRFGTKPGQHGGGGDAGGAPAGGPPATPPAAAPPADKPAGQPPAGGGHGDKPGRQIPAEVQAQIAKPASAYPVANPEGRDTQTRHKQPNGAYTPERQQLHKAMLASMSAGLKRQPDPTFFLTGGGPASGKGTLLKAGLIAEPGEAMHIDADEVKKLIPDYREMVAAKDTTAAGVAHEESSDVSNAAIAHAATNGFHAVYDSTGDSGIEKLSKKVGQMRAGGHKVVAHYVTVDSDEAVRRADERGKKTGRFVAHDVIRATHAAVSKVVPQALEAGLFDEFTLWDTNQSAPRKVASAKGKAVEIHDQQLWQNFLNKAK